jgi:hypothetical protein
VPGQIGLIQATEAIKFILKIGKPLVGRFLIYNALESDFRTFSTRKNPECALCGEQKVEDRKLRSCEVENIEDRKKTDCFEPVSITS